MDLPVIDVNMPTQSIEDRLDDIVDVTGHLGLGEVRQRG
jgi:hypothetical protein